MERKILNFPAGCAVVEDGRLVEYLDRSESGQSGDILMARVDRIMKGMDCAFADIGRRKDGFLPLTENSLSFSAGPIRSGSLIPVQIRREENGGKGALLSRDLSIPGTYVILMPMNRYIGVSSRITDADERERLIKKGQAVDGRDFGIIFRSAAARAAEHEIQEEISRLITAWRNIRREAEKNPVPGKVIFSSDPETRLKNDYPSADIQRAEEMSPDMIRQLSAAGQRTVSLKNGGNIVIDPCEAMTVIDVNSGSAHHEAKEQTVTETNLEACDEAAVQIRLRNITGIILIDFIDMDTETDRIRVEKRLHENFSADRRKTVIHGWTRLGIMEMTRKRV